MEFPEYITLRWKREFIDNVSFEAEYDAEKFLCYLGNEIYDRSIPFDEDESTQEEIGEEIRQEIINAGGSIDVVQLDWYDICDQYEEFPQTLFIDFMVFKSMHGPATEPASRFFFRMLDFSGVGVPPGCEFAASDTAIILRIKEDISAN